MMVWSLPDLELVHVLDAPNRIWALWGNSTILASAGSDCTISVRSLETGAILLTYPRSGKVMSLWGPLDGKILTSAGFGNLTVHKLGQAKVVHDFQDDQGAWVESVWSDGILLAWVGSKGMMARGVESGAIVREFPVRDVVRCLWGFLCANSGDYVMVIGFGTTVLALSIASGNVLQQWTTPGQVLTLVGSVALGVNEGEGGEDGGVTGAMAGVTLIVGGKWNSMCVLRLGGHTNTYTHIHTHTHLGGSATQMCDEGVQRMADMVVETGSARCAWLSNDAALLAYSDGQIARVVHLEDDSQVRPLSIECDAIVQSIWGCDDDKLLVTGLSNCCILVWELASAAELLRFPCGGPVRSLCGFGALADNTLSIVAATGSSATGTNASSSLHNKGSGVRVWRISGSASAPATATLCNSEKHTATRCHTLPHTDKHHKMLQHTASAPATATFCNPQKHTATHCHALPHAETHCNTLQHAATGCNALQHTASAPAGAHASQPLELDATHCNTHCNPLQPTAIHCNTLQHNTNAPVSQTLELDATLTSLNTLQHTATRCNTLQHTATHGNTLTSLSSTRAPADPKSQREKERERDARTHGPRTAPTGVRSGTLLKLAALQARHEAQHVPLEAKLMHDFSTRHGVNR